MRKIKAFYVSSQYLAVCGRGEAGGTNFCLVPNHCFRRPRPYLLSYAHLRARDGFDQQPSWSQAISTICGSGVPSCSNQTISLTSPQKANQTINFAFDIQGNAQSCLLKVQAIPS